MAETQGAVLPLVPYLDTLRWVLIALALAGIAVAVWARSTTGARGGADVGSLLAGIFARPRARWGAALLLAALTITLFLLNLRKAGERAGRAAERLDQLERTMPFNIGCWRRRRVALAIVTIWLSGCARGASDGCGPVASPPFVEYSREFQARAAEELALLPEDSAIAEMLSDYVVLREQARACAET